MANLVSNTSNAATATAYANQRKIDRCSNGVQWAIDHEANYSLVAYYSTDGGATWTSAGAIITFASAGFISDASLFIDQDDYANVIYRDASDGKLYLKRGTPNAGRTSYIWSAAVAVDTSTTVAYGDIIVFRDPGGSGGWLGYLVYSWADSTPRNFAFGRKITITSGGVVTIGAADTLSPASPGYGVNVHTFPSIDFQHTGDGKTPVASPNLYVSWSAGKIGAGFGIRFRKGTYSAGSWTWAAEREIEPSYYVYPSAVSFGCAFDGTAILIGGSWYSGSGWNVFFYERNEGDTTTTQRYSSGARVAGNYADYGSVTYDAVRNYYLIGSSDNASNTNIIYYKYDRASNTTNMTTITGTTGTGAPWVSVGRGYSSGKIRWIYMTGAVAPYSVYTDSLAVLVVVAKQITAKWNTYVRVAKRFTTLWNYPVRVIKQFTALFNVLFKVPATLTTKWNVVRHTDWTRVSEPTSDTYKRVDL